MGDSDLIAYRASISQFLMTCTIKNEWLADTYNTNLESQGYVVDYDNPETWKYYLNLQGRYHELDEIIMIVSRDTQTEIQFDYPTLITHPRTRAAYRPGMPDFTRLCKKYPNHTDFIKNVLFPVEDVSTAISAQNLTLLNWGIGYLEETEIQSVIAGMTKFLDYVYTRWYMDWMSYETYYQPAFWASLWQHLFAKISTIRIENMHTASAHTFHVWEYLTSMGIGDYRDILTRRQAMFLYRNMRYILKHRGEQANLILLVNRLLEEQSVAMVNKVIWQQTLDGTDECRWIPELLSEPIKTDLEKSLTPISPQTVQETMLQLNLIDMEHNVSLTNVDKVTREISATISNRLRTKLLEIQPVALDRKYAELLDNFIVDNLTYMVQNDRYSQQFVYQDTQTGIRLQLSAKDTLAFLYYIIWKTNGETAVNLPTVYNPLIGVFKDTADLSALSKYTTYKGVPYPVSSFTDIDNFIENAAPKSTYVTSTEFATSIGTMFEAMVRMIETIRAEGLALGVRVLQNFKAETLHLDTYALSLSAHTTYADWFADADHIEAADLVAAYDALDSDLALSLYSDITDAMMAQLIPTNNNEVINRYMYSQESSVFYGRISELFVQLCSYNVLFLDTERGRKHWEFLPRLLYDILEQSTVSTTYKDLSLAMNHQTTYVGEHDYSFSSPGVVSNMQAHQTSDIDAMEIQLKVSSNTSRTNYSVPPGPRIIPKEPSAGGELSTVLTFNFIGTEQ